MKYEYNKIIKKINSGWYDFFNTHKDELINIFDQINQSSESNIIFPNEQNLFRTLFYFPPEETKLVVLGQDPYIGFEIHDNIMVLQACGLSFSVPKIHKKVPPSLKNIYKEIKNCYPEFKIPNHGFLKRWVRKENILMLNSALTVIEKQSNSHQNIWCKFTDKLIKYISDKSPHTVFLLMGNFAISKSKLIDCNKHKIFTTIHPSPLSASNGFFGCGVFSKINEYLATKNILEIKY